MKSKIPAILGGDKTRRVPFPKRITMGQSEGAAVNEVMASDTLSAFFGSPGDLFLGGPKVKEFEEKWAAMYGFKHAISVNSWTAGLTIALGSVDVQPGDEVVCTGWSMSASASSCFYYGAIPVFADVDYNTYCIDPKSFEKLITPRTKAIIVVHLFGGIANMAEILRIAQEHNIRVIEDAAQSPGLYYRGKAVGALGDIGGFSLNYHKHIHTGEGGMLVTNNSEIAFKARAIRNHGENILEEYKIENISNFLGGNFRLTELQAAIGIVQLDKLEKLVKGRIELAKYFSEEMSRVTGLKMEQNDPDNNAYYVYPFKYDSKIIGLSRKLFVKAVLEEFAEPIDFEDTVFAEGYLKPLYLNPVYQQKKVFGDRGFPFSLNPNVNYEYHKGLCPVAEKLYESELILCPVIREPLTKNDINDIIFAVEKVVSNAKAINEKYPAYVDDGDVDYV